jgi:hypothetical protein
MELTERERIQEEEIFRYEIRKSLEFPRSRYNKILGFLNSGLGLWLLSTVSVSAITSLYSWSTNHFKQEQAQIIHEDRLTIELEARLAQWTALTSHLRRNSDDIQPEEFRRHWSELLLPPILTNGNTSKIHPVFPEFEKRGLLSLGYELHSLTKATTKPENVKKTEDEIKFLVEWDPIFLGYTSLDSYLKELKKYPLCFQLQGQNDSELEPDPKCI